MLWRYIGPYNWCDERDLFTSQERRLHTFGQRDEFWVEMTKQDKENEIKQLRQRQGRIDIAIMKIST